MKKLFTLIIATVILSFFTNAQPNKTFFLGHSLINFNIPNMVQKLSDSANSVFSYNVNIINGAPLLYHYTYPNSSGAQGSVWDTTLDNGGFQNFIFTEAIALKGNMLYNSTHRYADSLCSYAALHNSNIRHYVYETWHCTKSGNGSTSGVGGAPCDWDPESTIPWRTRLTLDLPVWESIADSLKLKFPNNVFVIPGGQALARLSDSIDAGAVPGLDSIEQLFTDDIHLSNTGNYFIACVMYSALHGSSPVGLPYVLTDLYDNLYSDHPASAAQALVLQNIAFSTVCDYLFSGIACAPLGIVVQPPVKIVVDDKLVKKVTSIYTITGSKIWNGITNDLELRAKMRELPTGLYIISQNEKHKLVQSNLY